MASTLSLDAIISVLEHCSPADLAVVSTVSRDVQLAAERILYRHIYIWKMSALDGLLLSINERRGRIVRRFDLLSYWSDEEFQRVVPPSLQGNYSGLLPKKLDVDNLVRRMPNLLHFTNDWPGAPGPRMLSGLPTGLRVLKIPFGLDWDIVSALRRLNSLTLLEIMECLSGSDANSRQHLCHTGLWSDMSILPELKIIAAPHCCALALLPGRKVVRMRSVNMLYEEQVDDLAALATLSATHQASSLTAVDIFVASGGERVLEHLQHLRGLVEVTLTDLGIKHMIPATSVDVPWATTERIGVAIRAFPALKIFRISTTFHPSFCPEEMDEDARRELAVCWAKGASSRLDQIQITKNPSPPPNQRPLDNLV
ncbi:hypothetical protein AURDEDRAFT_160551 [Auricularia subglabra TFB-10046 SS5]|nr:hypothetical protein AURDEDRAFT_160551 [Auricularia subglabra TFB-10046 SS5]